MLDTPASVGGLGYPPQIILTILIKILLIMIYTIVKVLDTKVDKNGTPCRVGVTLRQTYTTKKKWCTLVLSNHLRDGIPSMMVNH